MPKVRIVHGSHGLTGATVELDGVAVKGLRGVDVILNVDDVTTVRLNAIVEDGFEFEAADANVEVTLVALPGQVVDVTTQDDKPGVRRYRAVANDTAAKRADLDNFLARAEKIRGEIYTPFEREDLDQMLSELSREGISR